MGIQNQANILDLPVEITIEILKRLSAKDLTFSAQYVCSKWRTIIRSCDELWAGNFKHKSNFYEIGRALDYLKRSPRLQNIYIGKCDCPRGVGVQRDKKLVSKVCELGKKIKVLRLYDPHPDDVIVFSKSLPNLKVLQLEIGLYQINNGLLERLKDLNIDSKIRLEYVSVSN